MVALLINHEQLLLKVALRKLEALSEMIQKIPDLKKSICRINQRVSETLREWSLLLDRINVGYCNNVSVGSRTL